MSKKELEERYIKSLTKYYLHLVDVHLKETQKFMCAKMNNKFRRMGFKELRCEK